MGRLELPHLTALEPKSSVSTNSTTSAEDETYINSIRINVNGVSLKLLIKSVWGKYVSDAIGAWCKHLGQKGAAGLLCVLPFSQANQWWLVPGVLCTVALECECLLAV